MTGTHVDVQRVALRLRGIPVASARFVADGLGNEIASRLASGLGGASENLAVGDIRGERVHLPPRAAPAEVRAAVAHRIAAVVAKRAEKER